MKPYLHTYCVRADGSEAATACGLHSGTDCAPLAGRSGGGGGTAAAARRLSLGREHMTSSPWSVGLPFMLWNSWRLQARPSSYAWGPPEHRSGSIDSGGRSSPSRVRPTPLEDMATDKCMIIQTLASVRELSELS
jgi:hypothetical protein